MNTPPERTDLTTRDLIALLDGEDGPKDVGFEHLICRQHHAGRSFYTSIEQLKIEQLKQQKK